MVKQVTVSLQTVSSVAATSGSNRAKIHEKASFLPLHCTTLLYLLYRPFWAARNSLHSPRPDLVSDASSLA